jgi:hypothetical protein
VAEQWAPLAHGVRRTLCPGGIERTDGRSALGIGVEKVIRPQRSGPPFSMAFEPRGRIDVEEVTQARGDCREAAPSRRADRSRYERGGGNPGDRRERGYLRDELLDGEIFYSLREAQILIESWRRHYNTVGPHGALGYRPPAPEVFLPAFTAWPAALTPPAPPAKRPVEQRPTVH